MTNEQFLLRALLALKDLNAELALDCAAALSALELPDTEAVRQALVSLVDASRFDSCGLAELLPILRNLHLVEWLVKNAVLVEPSVLAALLLPELRRRATKQFLTEFGAHHRDDELHPGPPQAHIVNAALAQGGVHATMFRGGYADFEALVPPANSWFQSSDNRFKPPPFGLPPGAAWICNAHELSVAVARAPSAKHIMENLWYEHEGLVSARSGYYHEANGQLCALHTYPLSS